MAEASSHAEAMVREEWGQIVASLIAMTGDRGLAEECAQDAFTGALQAWDRDGVPGRPGTWLTTAARNRAVDVLQKGHGDAQPRPAADSRPRSYQCHGGPVTEPPDQQHLRPPLAAQ